MKQKLLNSIRLRAMMLVAVMCAAFAGQAWGDTASFTYSDFNGQGTSGTGSALTGATKGDVTITGIGYGNTSYLQVYADNYLTITPNSGVTITKVVITGTSTTYIRTWSASAGSVSKSGSTATWNGSSTSAITLTNTASGQARVTSIEVTYTPAAPAFSITAVSNNESYGTVSLESSTITATPADGYRVVAGDGDYTVTSGSATVTNNGDNTFSVSPSSNCTVQINFEAIPTYVVTINSPTGGTLFVMNGEDPVSSGDNIYDGTELTITATPDAEYNFRNWQAIDASTHTYSASNTGTYTINGHAVTFKANFDEKVYHNAIFQKYDGSEYVTHATKNTEVGQPIDFAGVSNPADLEGRTFAGWVAAKIDSPVDSPAPTFVTSANMGDADVTYYACYAYCTPGSTATETDELTTATFGSPASYTNWSNKQATSGTDAVYAGNTTTYNNTAIQMRDNSESGIVSTTSGGKAKKVTVTWNSNTTNGRTLNVYGKNTAYTASSDLYDDEKKGTLLGTIVYGTSTEFTITGDYEYIGLVSNKGAMYLDEIDIDWQTGTPDTYSGYCTTVPEDARTAVNIENFSATNTTLVIGGSPNTTTTAVTNDQDGWTESYIYTSDNTSVATVSDEGVITAVSKGTANITVTLNIPISGGSYKKGTMSSKSIEITVTKPFHTVTFMANGSELSSTSVEEDADIAKPSDPADVGNFSFQGWKEGSAIDGTDSSAPSYATITTMGDADVTYYAVYALEGLINVTATFNASDITATPETGNTREWKHTATGILLYLSAGQRYTSGTPNTFTVNNGTGKYFQISVPTGGVINQIVAEITEDTYNISSTTAGASVSTSGTTQTVTFSSPMNSVRCYATSSSQIRAKSITVDAKINGKENYCTTIPAYSVTVGDAGYTTYVAANNVSFPSGANAYIVTETGENTVTLQEVLAVETGTPVVVKAAAGTYNLPIEVSGDCDDVSDNLLLASDGNVKGNGTSIYALGKKNSKVGFYLVKNGETVPTGKAYLSVASSVKEFLGFNFDTVTGITETAEKTEATENLFDLSGRRVSKAQKGLYIVNGKKVLVK